MVNLSQLDRIERELKKYPNLEKEFTKSLEKFYSELTGKTFQELTNIVQQTNNNLNTTNSTMESVEKFTGSVKNFVTSIFRFTIELTGIQEIFRKISDSIDKISINMNSFFNNLKNKGFILLKVLTDFSNYFLPLVSFVAIVNESAKIYSQFLQVGLTFDSKSTQFFAITNQYGVNLREIVNLSKENFTVAKGIGINELGNFITRLRQSNQSLYNLGLTTELISRFTVNYLQTLQLTQRQQMDLTEKTEERIGKIINEMFVFSTLTNVEVDEIMKKIRQRIEDPFVRIAYRMIPEETARQLDYLSTQFPEVTQAILTAIFTGNIAFSEHYELLLRTNLLNVVQGMAKEAKEGTLNAANAVSVLKRRLDEVTARAEDLLAIGETQVGRSASAVSLQIEKIVEGAGNVTDTTKGVVPRIFEDLERSRAILSGAYADSMKSILSSMEEGGLDEILSKTLESITEMGNITKEFVPDAVGEVAENVTEKVMESSKEIDKAISMLNTFFSPKGIMAGIAGVALIKALRNSLPFVQGTFTKNILGGIRNTVTEIFSSIKNISINVPYIVKSTLIPVVTILFRIMRSTWRIAFSTLSLAGKLGSLGIAGRATGRLVGAGTRATLSTAKSFLQRTLGGPIVAILEAAGLTAEIYDLYTKYKNGIISEEEFKKRLSESIGSSLGGIGGAAAGAAAGSAILPFVGTALGGVAGYFGGAQIGEFLGQQIYENLIASEITQKVEETPKKKSLNHLNEIIEESKKIKEEMRNIIENLEKELNILEKTKQEKIKTAEEAKRAGQLIGD